MAVIQRTLCCVLLYIAGPTAGRCSAYDPYVVTFEQQVAPVFQKHCVRCHGATEPDAELDLREIAGLFRGSVDGSVIAAGDPQASRLFELITTGEMPADGKTKLRPGEVAAIRRWIEELSPDAVSSSRAVTADDVIPILLMRCASCHGRNFQDGGLDLRTYESILAGGESGPVVVLGDPTGSPLLQRIHAREMPPTERMVEAAVTAVRSHEVATIERWIAAGAPPPGALRSHSRRERTELEADNFWAFRAPSASIKAPSIAGASAIDAFVLRRLRAEGMTFSPEAKRTELLRRAWLDLVGFPPSPDEVERFLADSSPKAWPRMVERLLDSDHYGERWSRSWLDTVGYLDWNHAWRYRDYVVRSFNDDKPWDRFLVEQIAGDELVDYQNATEVTREMLDCIIATGFMRMVHDKTNNRLDSFLPFRMDTIAKQITVFSASVLGITLQCSQCHDHKFDPISQHDYYALKAVFQGAFDEYDWLPPERQDDFYRPWRVGGERLIPYLKPGTNAKTFFEQRRRELPAEEALRRQYVALKEQVRQRDIKGRRALVEQRWLQIKQPLRSEIRVALSTPAPSRSDRQQQLVEQHEDLLTVDRIKLAEVDAEFKTFQEETDKTANGIRDKLRSGPDIRALWDRGEPSPTYLFRRGDPESPGRRVAPATPAVFAGTTAAFEITTPWEGAPKTGRRLALARWLTQPGHPLTARVVVNRVWHGHFGRGLVATLDNFGAAGDKPSHPELLDWLAVEFVRRGWSVKQLHRLIMNSRTWKQSSRVTPNHVKKDPENVWLSRMPMRRMDAEALRDSLLVVAGRLDLTLGGPPQAVQTRADGLAYTSPTDKGWRRSIYTKQTTKTTPTILEVFDFPKMTPNCTRRTESTVAPQALHLMNDSNVRKWARSFAERVVKEASETTETRVALAHRIAFGREPTDEERELAVKALEQLTASAVTGGTETSEARLKALAKYCHTLMNAAEFIYID